MDQNIKTQNQNHAQKHEDEEQGSYVQVPLSETNEKLAPQSGLHSGDYAPYPKLKPEDIEDNRNGAWTTTMGSPANPEAHPANQQAATWVAKEQQSSAPPLSSSQSNPYVSTAPPPASSSKSSMEAVRDTLGRWGKKVGEATKSAEDFAGNVWQHLKTGPSLADTAMERLAQGTKVLTEGGYEKIFRQTFEALPEEQLQKTYACYLSTSAGPVIGTLYLTNKRLAFCSDNPLSYKVNPDKTEWSFYKVVLPLTQLKAINASANRTNPAEKYIQIISTDNHEFWFMGFVNYGKAVKNLQGILRKEDGQPSVGLTN